MKSFKFNPKSHVFGQTVQPQLKEVTYMYDKNQAIDY